MKIDGRSLAGFLKRPNPDCQAVLVFGEDSGLVRERAEVIARTVVEDLTDPFRVAELAGDTIADDPARLADEAAAMGEDRRPPGRARSPRDTHGGEVDRRQFCELPERRRAERPRTRAGAGRRRRGRTRRPLAAA
jgi:hypothetical protein